MSLSFVPVHQPDFEHLHLPKPSGALICPFCGMASLSTLTSRLSCLAHPFTFLHLLIFEYTTLFHTYTNMYKVPTLTKTTAILHQIQNRLINMSPFCVAFHCTEVLQVSPVFLINHTSRMRSMIRNIRGDMGAYILPNSTTGTTIWPPGSPSALLQNNSISNEENIYIVCVNFSAFGRCFLSKTTYSNSYIQ